MSPDTPRTPGDERERYRVRLLPAPLKCPRIYRAPAEEYTIPAWCTVKPNGYGQFNTYGETGLRTAPAGGPSNPNVADPSEPRLDRVPLLLGALQ